jgi:hypothetical protein
MTRAEKRQEQRAQEDELKRKKFEAQGFTFFTVLRRSEPGGSVD